MAPIISIEDDHVSYGGKTALDGVTLDIDERSSFALFDPDMRLLAEMLISGQQTPNAENVFQTIKQMMTQAVRPK